jgi:hypothetical protein
MMLDAPRLLLVLRAPPPAPPSWRALAALVTIALVAFVLGVAVGLECAP